MFSRMVGARRDSMESDQLVEWDDPDVGVAHHPLKKIY